MAEEILSTKDVYDGRIVHLKLHDVRLPDGNHGQREVIYHQGAAAIVAIDEKQEILFVRQYRIGAGQYTIEIPAGLIEADEDPIETISRELREETGYRPLHIENIGGFYVAPGYTSEYIHLYYTDRIEYAPLEQDADEFIEVVKIPVQKALEMIVMGTINEAKTIIAVLRIARKLGL